MLMESGIIGYERVESDCFRLCLDYDGFGMEYYAL